MELDMGEKKKKKTKEKRRKKEKKRAHAQTKPNHSLHDSSSSPKLLLASFFHFFSPESSAAQGFPPSLISPDKALRQHHRMPNPRPPRLPRDSARSMQVDGERRESVRRKTTVRFGVDDLEDHLRQKDAKRPVVRDRVPQLTHDGREDLADPGHVRIRIGGRMRWRRDPR